MLIAIGMLAGRNRWEKFGAFMISFGVWDIIFYVWLKIIIDWPATILTWDLLFLIPVPWLAPVLAPVLISTLLIIAGIMTFHITDKNCKFTPNLTVYLLVFLGCTIDLITFMIDTPATLHNQPPQPFLYGYFFIGIALIIGALFAVYNNSLKHPIKQ